MTKQTFYLATCHECKPVYPIAFYSAPPRDTWAKLHTDTTGHIVTSREEIK